MYRYPTPLVEGTFIKRYKRFLADMMLPGGQIVTAHTTNTGSLKSCLVPGAPVLLTPHNDPKRKTKFTWESIRIGNTWVGVNTSVPNKLVYNALKQKSIPGLEDFDRVRAEVKQGKSRLDILLENEVEKMWLEIKNVTYREGDAALFPDAPTARGLKHLEELIALRKQGFRAGMIFVVGRTDVQYFAPARHIDPGYAHMLREALSAGVEIFPLSVAYDRQGARITGLLPYEV